MYGTGAIPRLGNTLGRMICVVKATHALPLALTAARAAAGPVLLAVATVPAHASPAILVALLVLAFVSDVLDGVIARRLGIATATLRRLDSVADSIFYVCAAAVAWRLHPQALTDRLVPLSVLVALELARYVVDYARYRREASYHMWSSKAWGACLFIGFVALLGFGHTGGLVSLAVYAGIAADLEGLAISLVLDEWHHDVPTVFHALRLRRDARRRGPPAAPPPPASQG